MSVFLTPAEVASGVLQVPPTLGIIATLSLRVSPLAPA